MKTSEFILQAAAEIEEILSKHQMPVSDPSIPERLRFVASRLTGRDFSASENAVRIVSLANDFYSAKRHEKHSGGYESIWKEMRALIGRLRDSASIRESNRD
jgi:hypothetical protein